MPTPDEHREMLKRARAERRADDLFDSIKLIIALALGMVILFEFANALTKIH